MRKQAAQAGPAASLYVMVHNAPTMWTAVRCATNKLANPLNWDNNPAPAGPIYWSGRQDSNLRPLDPQDVEVSISTGQTGHKRRVHAWLTCGSSACVQVVWSPNGPQQDAPPIPYLPRPGRRSRRGAGVNG